MVVYLKQQTSLISISLALFPLLVDETLTNSRKMGQQISISVLAESVAKPANHPDIKSAANMEIPPECPMHANYQKKQADDKVLVTDGSQADVNPLNMMPPANQQPSPGQPFTLPTERQTSTIPRAIPSPEGKEFWEYPSQQM